MQSAAFVLPVFFEALPGGQLVQSVADDTPLAEEYVADGQGVQDASADSRFSSTVSGLPC